MRVAATAFGFDGGAMTPTREIKEEEEEEEGAGSRSVVVGSAIPAICGFPPILKSAEEL
jgi:hypothetical protein